MKMILKSPKITVIFITTLLYSLSYFIPIGEIIISSFNFLILMEVVRTTYEYMVNPSHRVKMRFVIDSAILFGIRELFVGWVMLKSTEVMMILGLGIPSALIGLAIMIISMITIGALIFYRYKVIMSSPDQLEPDSNKVIES